MVYAGSKTEENSSPANEGDLIHELHQIRSTLEEKKREAQATHNLHISQISEINHLEFKELRLFNKIKKEIGL